ncbi:phospholipase A2-like [Oppia nitens]|uniref:phospholipase A2-like n=1 Tax=Oppia nitens TaxID=1686743 RepID=UPI0023DAA099|nr:phospholipase A2-like [Oppia nitens]
MVEIEIFNNTIVDCFLYGDKRIADKVLANKVCKPKEQYVDRQVLTDWALKCSQWLSGLLRKGTVPTYGDHCSESDSDFPKEYNNKIDRNFFDGILIYPGTKWCGAGNIAEDDLDYGTERETDKCCQTHDYCFDSINSGETKHNLTNEAIYTKSHCYCDQEFQGCLQTVDTKTSKRIAKLFFNLIQVQCFKRDHPIVNCLEYRGIPFFWQSCQKYELDFTKPLFYQFFDAMFVD